MIARYTNTYADALAFATVHNLRSTPLLAFIFLVALLCAWSWLPTDVAGFVRFVIFVVLELIFFCVLLAFQLLFNAYWFAFNRDSNFLTEHCVELTEFAFVESTAFTRVEIQWPGILAMRAGLGRFFVFEGPGRAHCIPVRAFATRGDFEAFVSQAKEFWHRAKSNA